MRRGVYPGSFNPPTVAHLAISRAALDTHRLDVVVWSVSNSALGKASNDADRSAFSQRLAVLEDVAAGAGWLRVETTDRQLLADIAEGFDLVIMGADKWHQIHELRWYDSAADRDRALARLPTAAVAPRSGFDVDARLVLPVDPALSEVSSSAARAGDRSIMLPEAVAHDRLTGLWTGSAE